MSRLHWRWWCAFLVCGVWAAVCRGEDWPNLFGPTHDSVSAETNVGAEWPKEGPPVLWRIEIGTGYSAPSVADGKLVLFHRKGNKEIVECLDAVSGRSLWSFDYPTAYVDRYGYNGGPRCTPIINGGRVYTYGAEGSFHCLEIATGKKVWSRPLNQEYEVEQGFFGVGASPLLEEDRLIVNVGGKTTGAGIVALDKASGKTIWKATNQGASYATPRAATMHGKRFVFVFTEAGLVSLDPKTGNVHWSIPFRSKLFESANATSPVIVEDIVVVSATYNTGTLVVRVKPDSSYEELWRDRRKLESHFSNIIHDSGYLYAFSGRHEGESDLRCVSLKTGEVQWRLPTVLGRGSMIRAGERLILWGERGHLASMEINPKKPVVGAYTERALLSWPTWTPPVLSGGRLYLRNEETLLCVDLRKRDGGETSEKNE